MTGTIIYKILKNMFIKCNIFFTPVQKLYIDINQSKLISINYILFYVFHHTITRLQYFILLYQFI